MFCVESFTKIKSIFSFFPFDKVFDIFLKFRFFFSKFENESLFVFASISNRIEGKLSL